MASWQSIRFFGYYWFNNLKDCMKRILLLFALLTSVYGVVQAQTRQVSGIVTDKVTNDPIPGVSITIKGTPIVVSTNVKGEYKISVPTNGTVVLQARYIGYKAHEITLNSNAKVNFSLSEDVNSLNEVVVNIGYGSVRKELITSVSDVLIYESSFWRDRIRDTVRLAVEKYAAANDQVTVIAHSLGTVVSFDTLYYNSRHNPNWLMNQFKPKNFYTMGSPIALFSLEMDDAIGNQKPRYVSAADQPADMGDISFIQKDGEWINFFDAQDLIGYPLETLFKDKFSVMDQIVNTGFLPLSSHLKYWENKDIAEKISSKLFYDITNNQVNIKI